MRILSLSAMLISATFVASAAEYFMYVGTYTGPESKGIYVYRFETATGGMSNLGLAAEAENPSFLAIHPSGDYLYSVDEAGSGSVRAFRIDHKTGKLKLLNKVPSRGTAPCALAVDPTGRNVLVANYSSGSVALLRIKTDGSLAEASVFDQHKGSSVNRERQAGPHAHSAVFAPGNRFALVADLGMDKVFVYRFDAEKGTLVPNDPPYATVPAGSGPRHIVFHPNGKFVFVTNELDSTVTAFAWNGAAGALKPIESVSALPKGYKGTSDGAEIQVHPNGKFLYSSLRQAASNIASFRIDPMNGTLQLDGNTPSGGKEPRYFGFDPSGAWIVAANQHSNNIVLFRVDPNTGKLSATGKTVAVPAPVCVQFVAAK